MDYAWYRSGPSESTFKEKKMDILFGLLCLVMVGIIFHLEKSRKSLGVKMVEKQKQIDQLTETNDVLSKENERHSRGILTMTSRAAEEMVKAEQSRQVLMERIAYAESSASKRMIIKKYCRRCGWPVDTPKYCPLCGEMTIDIPAHAWVYPDQCKVCGHVQDFRDPHKFCGGCGSSRGKAMEYKQEAAVKN